MVVRNGVLDPNNQDILMAVARLLQHDTACDWYGRRIATCSSDKTVKIFDTEAEVHEHRIQ